MTDPEIRELHRNLDSIPRGRGAQTAVAQICEGNDLSVAA